MWPFYEKAQELDVPLTIHTGHSYVVPQPGNHCDVRQLDNVLPPACRGTGRFRR